MVEVESLLSLLWKGIVIGIIVSAPLGPVGVLCIQRTLNKGRWYGFVTGIGAAISDIFYALLTGFGMSFVFDYVQQNMYYLQLLGSLMLLGFGIYTFRSNPVNSIRTISANKGTYVHNMVTAFFVTLSNPLIIFLFIGLFARFSFVSNTIYESFTLYAAIAVGALLWWFFITTVVSKLRERFDVRGVWIINRVIGVLVMAGSLIGAILIVTGIYSFH
jgi:threonine/homoserine/homoserine lactone efflux protein